LGKGKKCSRKKKVEGTGGKGNVWEKKKKGKKEGPSQQKWWGGKRNRTKLKGNVGKGGGKNN